MAWLSLFNDVEKYEIPRLELHTQAYEILSSHILHHSSEF